jgi:deoxyribonuclease IV
VILGAHESIAGGVSRAFARAEAHGAQSLQIFTKNARGWSAPPLQEAEAAAFRAEAARSGLPSIAHGSYLVNLATEDAAHRERSLDCVTEELTRCERLGVGLLVMHPGGHPDERRGLRLIAQGLDEVHARTRGFRARICLEITAGQGSCLGWRFEHLAEILGAAQDEQRLSVCLDTCHLYAAGYDLSTERGYAQVMEACERSVGLHRVGCFHLNDCKKGLGCRVDRHEEIGRGALGLTAFRCLVNDPRFQDTIGVLETPVPERYGDALQLLHSLVRTY